MKHINNSDRVESISDELQRQMDDSKKYESLVQEQIRFALPPKQSMMNVIKKTIGFVIFVIGLITIVKFVIGLM